MKKYELSIRLLSDLCVSDGGVYNSSLDMDICHDEYGFPYIPARRIKGCLRECARELRDWGREDIDIEKMFGSIKNERGAVSIRNAYVENYGHLREQVVEHRNSLLFHPQNVLSHYSYIRTQTAVDKETGTAKDKYLRAMRVAKKDLVFVAEVEMEDEYKSQFDDILAVFHYMGISRTRGLGEIEAKCRQVISDPEDGKEGNRKDKVPVDMEAVKRQIEKEGCLWYSVYLEEPLICKSVEGGESRSQDYIQGSRILGIVLQQMREAGESVEDFLGAAQEMFFSNAYLEEEGKRLTEVPATYYSIKDNNDEYIDRAYENENNRTQADNWQMNAMRHCYVGKAGDGSTIKKSVEMEQRYHHRRPEDKSIGRAIGTSDDMGVFYQVSGIAAGQSFRGYVTGTEGKLLEVAQYLSAREYFSIGTSRSAEYGKVRITLDTEKIETGTGRMDLSMPAEPGRHLLIKLESPAIVYSRENVTSSVDVKDLVEEVNAALGLNESGDQPDSIEQFVNVTSVGGYNVTWGGRKPTVDAFDKGTVLIYHFENPPSLSMELKENPRNSAVIGERNLEGYGEVSIRELTSENGRYRNKWYSPPDGLQAENGKINEKINVKETELADRISQDIWKEYIRVKARVKAESFDRDKLKKARAVVSNLLSICYEQKKWKELKDAVKQRFKDGSKRKRKKKEIAEGIINVVDGEELSGEFCAIYNIYGWEADENQSKKDYLKAYLTELRYRIREHEKQEGGNPA